jgi:Predicted transcriptional regulators
MRNWLKVKREEKNMTQVSVANKCEIKQPTYFYIENGERNPSVNVAKKIAAVLDFDWTLFFADEVITGAKGKESSESGATA